MFQKYKRRKKPRFKIQLFLAACPTLRLKPAYLEDHTESEAITEFVDRIGKLKEGDEIELSYWDKRARKWVLMRRGGNDNDTKIA